MNTSSLKTFAQNARNKLRAQVAARLNYWVGAEGGTAPDTAAHRQFAPQIRELRVQMAREGRDGMVERVSYLWFNRLAALRFMDANDFHPFGVRVVSPAGENDILPALLQQSRAGAMPAEIRAKLANPQAFDDILAGRIPVAHPETELFGMLLLAACNYYHDIMPFLFEELGDATQLLLPEDLLSAQSILTDIRENLSAEDCKEVEVIGWLYQFYISGKKATAMEDIKKEKRAYRKEEIPAVTQLFTPHWIVRYLVENSLGRLWLLNRPHSRLREHMPYYIEEVPSDQSSVISEKRCAPHQPEPPPDLFSSTDHRSLLTAHSAQGETSEPFPRIDRPEDIRLIDPACGSAHMLTYAFDLLYLIYEEEGYDAKDIPSLILRHNLHGTEICERAAALAAFALCMKARAKDRRFFKRLTDGGEDAPKPRIMELRDVRFDEGEIQAYFKALRNQSSALHPQLVKLLHQFEKAKSVGSLIQPCLNEAEIQSIRSIIQRSTSIIQDSDLLIGATHGKVLCVLDQAEMLSQRYQVAVANPPYLGRRKANDELREILESNYQSFRADLFSGFMSRGLSLVGKGAYLGLMTPTSWFYLSSFEEARSFIIDHCGIVCAVELDKQGFAEAAVHVCSFVLQNSYGERNSVFVSLEKCSILEQPIILADTCNQADSARRYVVRSQNFTPLPGKPLAYWLSDTAMEILSRPGIALGDALLPRQGMATGNNGRFLRLWFEIGIKSLIYNADSKQNLWNSSSVARPFVPYNKGGSFRKWYGNRENVLAFSEADYKALKQQGNHCPSEAYYFKGGITWSDIVGETFAARHNPNGSVFDVKGSSAFPENPQQIPTLLCLLNSKVTSFFKRVLNPGTTFQVGDISRIPFCDIKDHSTILEIRDELVDSSKSDWDNFETSWDFRNLPLLRSGLKGAMLEVTWENWNAHSTAAIRRMQELETENNRIFIKAYGLGSELDPKVPADQITLARADRATDMAAFISYAVGCMMGRYSLDAPGLILANAGDTLEEFRAKVSAPTFLPDEDAILPVLDGEWFNDDIVGRFREFLRVTFGDASFTANLRFIEESLGRVDSKTGRIKPTDIRSYFVRDFYKNHLSNERAYGYKKRPIYWMVSSPNGSFQALIYLHRYTRDTMNHVLDRYVRPFIDKLEQRQQTCTVISTDAAAKPAERTAAQKELVQLAKMLKEIREWERDSLLPIAQQRIELDLDDGVKVNYLKFKGVLVPIPGLEKKED